MEKICACGALDNNNHHPNCPKVSKPHPEQADGFNGCTCTYVGARCSHCRKLDSTDPE